MSELYKYQIRDGRVVGIEYTGKWFVLNRNGKYLRKYSYGNGVTPKPEWTSHMKFALKLQEDGVARHIGDLTANDAIMQFGGKLEEVA